MKRKIIVGISFIIMTLAFNACESLGSCKICKQVTYDTGDNSIIEEGTEAEYCDAALIAIEAKSDVVVGNTRLSWECR
jgi:hypothetical protein